ncbi:hypothetical protein NDU88_005701 [Pleurodeles waltl]|uniref:Uncharacterized protein n=1 Tax=Pleurodeles waltl TaxID=8319 RepID=A0AAV7VMH5_PLEWA|nr:hypothetical protein NDU88_005701 [Pleurodeles waltl]
MRQRCVWVGPLCDRFSTILEVVYNLGFGGTAAVVSLAGWGEQDGGRVIRLGSVCSGRNPPVQRKPSCEPEAFLVAAASSDTM